MTERLVYSTDPAEIVRFARQAGFSTQRIVRELTHGETAKVVAELADRYALLLGITPEEFSENREEEAG